tara:strand:- start:24294 stop:25487 length:1194 start_codon:yes stop_codon:yes gene_type:complete
MICIAGKNEIAVNALKFMVKIYPEKDLVVMVNKNDDGVNNWQPSLRFEAENRGVKIVTLKEVYGISDLLFLSLEFDQIIKPELFKSKRLFNIHFSLLPKYKGMFTSILPILNGEDKSGVTLHRIDSGIDTGEIINQIEFSITEDLTGRGLYQLYLDNGLQLFEQNIDDLIMEKETSYPQKYWGASYYSKKILNFSQLSVDFNQCAFQIHNFIRSFTFRDYQLINAHGWTIYGTKVTTFVSEEKPGTLISSNEYYLEIATIDYNIRLFKDYYELLFSTIENDNLNDLYKIIDYIPDINLRNKLGWNAVIVAVYHGKLEILDVLIKNGGNIHSTNYKGTTVLMYAKSNAQNTGNVKMLKKVLSYKPNLLERDSTGHTVFDYLEGGLVTNVELRKILNND